MKWSGTTWKDFELFDDWHDLLYWLQIQLKLALEDLKPQKTGIQ